MVKIIAPLPDAEVIDVPTMFIALTLAYIDDPQGKLNGEFKSVDIGTEQVSRVLASILQSLGSVENDTLSLCLISTLYPVMGVDPSPGKVQLITTLLLLTAVVGATGVSGIWAARTASPVEEME